MAGQKWLDCHHGEEKTKIFDLKKKRKQKGCFGRLKNVFALFSF